MTENEKEIMDRDAREWYRLGEVYEEFIDGEHDVVKYYYEAVKCFEALVSEYPEQYSAHLADALCKLAGGYGMLGDRENANGCYDRAISIYEELVRDVSELYKRPLAAALYSYADAVKSVELYRRSFSIAREEPNDKRCREICRLLDGLVD